MNPDIFVNDYTVLKRCKHGCFLFNRNDRFIGRALDLYGEWCEHEIETLAQLVRPGDVVLDIGANIGTHTIALANMVKHGGVVLAIEAQRTIYNYLVANVAINNLLHVVCMNNAAGASTGPVLVPVLNPSAANNFGGVNVASQSAGERIECVTVDSLGLTQCRLIKIDVEGMEPQVLWGSQQTIERYRPFIFVEATIDNSREVIEILTRFRYNCQWHIASYFNSDNFYQNSNNVFRDIHPESNLVCSPRESEVVIPGLEPVTGPEDNWLSALERVRKAVSG
jgi:FkbM family methyltransferase